MGFGKENEIQKKFSHVLITLAESDKIQAPNYSIIEKPKKAKKEVITTKKKATKDVEEKIGGEKKGFMQKVFNRKAV